MNKNSKLIFIYLYLLLFSCIIRNGSGESVLLKYDIGSYEAYGSSIGGCSLVFGALFKDNYRIKSFSSNIKPTYTGAPPSVLLEEGDLHLYQLNMFNISFGINSQLVFNVTNYNDETSVITIDKSFNCQKLQVPIEFDYFTTNFTTLNLYLDNYLYFDINKSKYFNGVDISSSLTCRLSFSAQCSISKDIKYFKIYGFSFNETNRDELLQPKLKLWIYDLYGGEQLIMVNNNIIDINAPLTEIKSYQLSLPNNSVIDTQFETNTLGLKVTYKSLNSIPVIDTSGTNNIYFNQGYFLSASPDSVVYYFVYYLGAGSKSTFYYKEFPNANSPPLKMVYSSSERLFGNPVLAPSFKLLYNQTLNKFIYQVDVAVPYLSADFWCSSVKVRYDLNNSLIQHPYGVSKSISDSKFKYSTESLMFFSDIPSEQFIQFYKYQKTTEISIPNYPGIVSNDTQPPMVHSFTHQVLENNKIISTLNISDVGSGLYQVVSLQPSFSFFAKEYLVSGDTNNGIYQILSSTESVILNYPFLSLYDEYAANSMLASSIYKDFNFAPPDKILPVIPTSDITFFEFDRHEIDTSFNQLELNLRVGFKGASETSVIPYVALSNGGRVLRLDTSNQIFKGVFNKTTQLYDIKIRAPARETGTFKYSLAIPPLSIDNTQIETLFPNQVVKLSTNYIDHCPPSIRNLKALNDTQLFIPKGQPIEIGWNIEIYDYPVGLDNALIQVVSNIDFEPFTFEFRPNTSVPGSDILSNYTILIPARPFENQTFYISSVKLTDRNGYYSVYPTENYIPNYDAFFDNKFLPERNIRVNITQDSVGPSYEYDDQAPQLLDFSFPSSFDSFGINRSAVCEFSIKDIGASGVSSRHNPYIYIQFLYSRSIRVQSELVTIDNQTLVHYYRAIINFDYGILAYGALVSIHGITDNSLNIASLTSQKLLERGFNSTISNPIQNKPPVILEFSSLNEDGGKFFIYGKEFKDSPIVYMDLSGNGSDFKSISVVFKSNLAITALVPSVKGYKAIQFKVISNGISSNVIQAEPIINPTSLVSSNCSQFNQCSGMGQCVNSKCVCIEGSEGPDCSSSPQLIENKPKDNTPSFSSFNSMIEINVLEEIDILGNVIKSYPLESWYSSTIKSQYQPLVNAYQYTQHLEGTSNSNITIVVDIFEAPLSINFATNKLQMNKGTIKYTITFNSYPFGSRFNTLQLKINASISSQDSKCKLNSISLDSNNNIEYIKLRADDQSLYGKFIQNAVIDYRLITINNKLLKSPSIENQQALIGIQIPYFFETATLDPDFSILFDIDNLDKNKESNCYLGDSIDNSGSNGGGSKNDNGASGGLSNTKIIVISVVCGFAAISIFIGSIILIKKKRSLSKIKKRIIALSLNNH